MIILRTFRFNSGHRRALILHNAPPARHRPALAKIDTACSKTIARRVENYVLAFSLFFSKFVYNKPTLYHWSWITRTTEGDSTPWTRFVGDRPRLLHMLPLHRSRARDSGCTRTHVVLELVHE